MRVARVRSQLDHRIHVRTQLERGRPIRAIHIA